MALNIYRTSQLINSSRELSSHLTIISVTLISVKYCLFCGVQLACVKLHHIISDFEPTVSEQSKHTSNRVFVLVNDLCRAKPDERLANDKIRTTENCRE